MAELSARAIEISAISQDIYDECATNKAMPHDATTFSDASQ
ncbi:hypothetical protein ACFFLZ_08605 [Photobacterium aphoticum]|nr:hypothetical protein [Photobacterium aphoticum]